MAHQYAELAIYHDLDVVSHGDGSTILYLHANGRDLRVTFMQIWALAIHEEFAHPDVDGNFDFPLLNDNPGAYPLLMVTNSEWLKSFSDTRLATLPETPIHFQFISMSYIVDVLSYVRPEAEWVHQAVFET